MKEFAIGCVLLVIGVGVVIGGVFGIMAGWAEFRGYFQERRGEAALREADWDRQITITEANAANEAATLNAQVKIKLETANAEAEIVRAKGVAEANKIIAEGLKDNEEYLQYKWIDKLTSGSQVIYVPTEAGLPILEAGKRP